MPIPDSIAERVEQFEASRKEYHQGHYNETQTRIDYVNPLFAALGWDMNNRQGLSEALREVVHEDAVKVGGRTKAPDYGFRAAGQRKFFLETKKPSVHLKLLAAPAFQLRRYAWTAKLPVSILTNFEEFVVYDGRVIPDEKDGPSIARLDYFLYTDLADRWDTLAGRFSKEAVLSGGFDRYAQEAPARKTHTPVDAAFLSRISAWRELLARSIVRNNPDVTGRELNFAVQMIIDRIIFLRISEDRGVETQHRLEPLLNGKRVYPRLLELFQFADDRYNSGLFHFKPEKGRGDVDDVTPRLTLEDRVLHEILSSLYGDKNPYEFSVFPADILGQVYEQFLGKVVHVSGKTAVVEDKPEVKKAGGVYYTPTYIVDYIVRNTVGTLVEGKTPAQVAKLTVLDPACGSGSFLIGAYQFLLDWHLSYYTQNNQAKWAGGKNAVIYPFRKDAEGGDLWRLTTAEKKRILLQNIYGVDIDTQAVEVTKLSLLLKVLENESAELIDNTLKFFQERALPDLESNIKCGNSLIGPDFYTGKDPALFDLDARLKINTFDWHKGFPAVMKTGGFDAVIGNPPYVNVDDTWGKGDPRLSALKTQYAQIYNDKTDLLFYFLAKAVELGKQHVSFIISRAFLEAYKADKLRTFLLSNAAIEEIIDFRNFYVFPKIGITTCIISFSPRKKSEQVTVYQLLQDVLPSFQLADHISDATVFDKFTCSQIALSGKTWAFSSEKSANLSAKLDSIGEPLGKVLFIGKGMETGRNGIFGGRTLDEVSEWNLTTGQFYRRATNSDIQRYHIKNRQEYLLYLEDVPSFKKLPSSLQEYLKLHRKELEERAAYKRGDCEWWQYTWPLHKECYKKDRLLCPYLATGNRFAIDTSQRFIGLTDTTVLFENGQPEDLRYLMGLLNSRLLTFRFKTIGKLKSGGILEYFWNSISKLPIKRIDFSNPSEKAKHDKMVSLVERMLTLHKDKAAVRLAQEKDMLEQEIEGLDAQIDRLVYALYGLTEDEIALVEGAG